MTTGFMWLDEDRKRPLPERLLEAAERHLHRHGTWLDRREVPLGLVPDQQDVPVGSDGHVITVLPVASLPAHHWFLWRHEDAA